jgi:hypothetical protein
VTVRAAVATILFPLAIALAGCGGGDPLNATVAARTPNALASWRARVASDSSAAHRQRVEDGLSEIRMAVAAERDRKRILGERIVPGPEAIDTGLCERVNGLRVGEMLQLAAELRVRRLAAELAALEDAMGKNAQLLTRPGDLESRHHLDGLRERQQVRVEKYREDLAKARSELEPLMGRSGRSLLPPETGTPDQPPRQIRP